MMKLPSDDESIVGFLKKRPFLLDLENAERDTGKDVVAFSKTAPLQLIRQRGSISMNHMHSRIICELPLQISRERRVELKQKQMRIRSHPPRHLT